LTATNYGLIEAENVTLSWAKYWDNVEFVLPKGTGEVENNDGVMTIELGDLPANSTISVTIQVNLLWEIPGDRVVESRGDYIILWPRPDDPSWFTGPSVLVAPYSDPMDGRYVIKLTGESGEARGEYAFFYANQTLITFVYDDNGSIVDLVVTENAPEPDDRRLVLASEPRHRQLSCFSWGAGFEAAALALGGTFTTLVTGKLLWLFLSCLFNCADLHSCILRSHAPPILVRRRWARGRTLGYLVWRTTC